KFMTSALIPLLPESPGRTTIVRAEEGREDLLEELRKRGGEVHLAVAYRNVPVTHDANELHDIDVVTFTSASTVDNFFASGGKANGALVASIGPITSDAIRKHGRAVDVEASAATIAALHDAVVARLSR